MAAAVAGAAIGGIANVIGSAIQAGTQKSIANAQNSSNQLMQGKDIDYKLKALGETNENNIQIQQLQGNTSRDVANISGLTSRDVANIGGLWQNQINERNTQTQLKLQQQELDRSQLIRDNLVKQLTAAGLPSYLAYVQPDESMLQTRRVGGHNVTIYKGSNMRLYGIQG